MKIFICDMVANSFIRMIRNDLCFSCSFQFIRQTILNLTICYIDLRTRLYILDRFFSSMKWMFLCVFLVGFFSNETCLKMNDLGGEKRVKVKSASAVSSTVLLVYWIFLLLFIVINWIDKQTRKRDRRRRNNNWETKTESEEKAFVIFLQQWSSWFDIVYLLSISVLPFLFALHREHYSISSIHTD